MALELESAVHVRSFPGAPRGGDMGLVRPLPGGALVALIDATGHGLPAYAAAQMARKMLLNTDEEDPSVLLQQLHTLLAGTVGAAISIARVYDELIRFAGVGNVAAQVGRKALVASPGVIGQRMRTARTHESRFEPGVWFLMHTDGVAPPPSVPPGSADTAARALVDTHGSRLDDAAVALVRWREVIP